MSFHSTIMPTRLFGIRHLGIRMSLGMSRDQFSALGFFLVQYCVGNCFEQRQCFVNDFEWFCDWVNAIFSKNAIFIGFFPIIAQSRDRKCKFLYTFREGSSRWTKWYITLVDTLPNKNVRGGGRNPPPPPVRSRDQDWPVRASVKL